MAESAAQLFSRLGAKELLGDLDLPIFSQLTPEAHGLKPGDVIEFTGAEGTGKSEILLNIAVQCSLPKTWQGRKLGGREGEVLYISTDYKFDVFRLMTILEGRVLNEALHTEAIDETTPQGVPHSKSEYKELISSSLARVHVAYCCSSSELAVSLQSLKTFLHNHPKVCVLMLDNVAAYYWTDRGKTAVVEGNEHQWITSLNELKQEYHLIVFAAKPLLLNKPIMIMSKQKGEYDGKTRTAGHSNDFMPRLWQRTVKYRFHLECVPNRTINDPPSSELVTPTFIAHQIHPLGPSYKYKVCEHGLTFLS